MTVIVTAENRHEYAEALFNPKRRGGDPGTKWTAARRADMEQMLKAGGAEKPVTILNLNCFPLKINGGVFFPDEIPACPIGQPCTIHVITKTRWGHRDIGSDAQGMMQMEPFAAFPMMLATEYIREFAQMQDGFGGVIAYIGQEDPKTFKPGHKVMVPEVAFNPEGVMYIDVHERDFHQIFGAVKEKRNTSLLRKLEAANAWDANDATRLFINDTHRDMWRLAEAEGLVDKKDKPRWVMTPGTLAPKHADPCPACQVEPKAGAVLCVNCGYVFNPLEAYRLSMIAHGNVAMERLTAKEWELANQLQAERQRARGVKSSAS